MEGNSMPAFKTIIIDNIKYKTTLTKKYMARKAYEPVDFGKVYSFIPGTIREVFVSEGAKVKRGAHLLELEAMKMVNNITTPLTEPLPKSMLKPVIWLPKTIFLWR